MRAPELHVPALGPLTSAPERATPVERATPEPATAAPEPATPVERPIALYLHVPFCISICPYCDFVVVAGSASRGPRNRIAAFVEALATELELRADALDAAVGPPSGTRPPLASLYLGGGTPSLLPAEAIGRLIELVRRRYGLAPGAEVTLEANPGPAERGDAVALRGAGVTRLSIGAQSLDAGELRRLGRRHAPADVASAVGAARAAGIPSISLDLLYDVPGATEASWAHSLEAALALGPDHLSLYALTLDDPDAEGLTGPEGDHLPLRPGARRWRATAVAGQDEDRAAAMYEHAVERLARAGYVGYEISNWAQPGHESRHNLAYWERRPHMAAGPGAHGFDGATRWWNAARLDAYLAALDAGLLPPGGSETVDDATAAAERVVLALRTAAGVPATIVEESRFGPALRWAVETGLAATAEGRVSLTTRGRLLADEVFTRLV